MMEKFEHQGYWWLPHEPEEILLLPGDEAATTDAEASSFGNLIATVGE